jgi:hypothetical protein
MAPMTTATVTAATTTTRTAAAVVIGGRNKDNGGMVMAGSPDNNQPKASAGHGSSRRNRGGSVGCLWSQVVSTIFTKYLQIIFSVLNSDFFLSSRIGAMLIPDALLVKT